MPPAGETAPAGGECLRRPAANTLSRGLCDAAGVLLARLGDELGGDGSAGGRHGDRTIQRSTLLPGVYQVVALVVVHAPDFEVDAHVGVEAHVPGGRFRVPEGFGGYFHEVNRGVVG